jgi:tetratricopeptide (TPR) repeat protein
MARRASAHAHFAAGIVLDLQHHRSRALEEFRQAALLAPENEALVWEVSRKFIAAQQPQTAVQLLSAAADRPDASGLTWARLAAVELQSGNSKAAIEAGRQAIAIAPSVVHGHQSVFLAYLQAGELDEARRVLEQAAPHGAGDPKFLVQLSELYPLLIVQMPADRAALQAVRLRLLQQAEGLPLDDDRLRMRLADGFADLNQNDHAAELYQELLETMEGAPGVRDIIRSKLTEAYLRGKDPSQARAELKRLLRRDPTNARVCYLLGSLAYEDGDFDVARDYFERVLVLRPEFEQAYYDLSGTLLNLDRVEQANTVVERARLKFPQSFAMEMLSALVHMRLGESAAAVKHFTTAEITAQALDPDRLTQFFYFQYGAANEQAGEYVAAERHLQKSLELDPNFAPSQNYLGYMWAERGEHLEEALELIQQAVWSEPENAAYLDSLGWVLFKLGRAAEALDYLMDALEHLEEPDPTVYDHVGDVHAELGDLDQAVEAWQRSFDIEPADPVRDKLEQAGHPVLEPATEESADE